MNAQNPWVTRYEQINSIDIIRTLTFQPATPLSSLDDDSIEGASIRIGDAWRKIFVPTGQACEIMLTFIQAAKSHAERYYPDAKTFLENVYDPNRNIEPFSPFFLTGPAGVGKSKIRNALEKLLDKEEFVVPNPYHGKLPLIGIRSVVVREKVGKNDFLRALAKPELMDESIRVTGNRIIRESARWLYQSGCCLVIADELQFITQSATANTQATNSVKYISHLGMPSAIFANYSLVHRLMKRPQEDRQRLLTRPLILLPDAPESPDWIAVLTEMQKAVPHIYEFSFEVKAFELWGYCAGIMRVLTNLLLIAYRLARKIGRSFVMWADIESAYLSNDFFTDRQDVSQLILHGDLGGNLRGDLRCPFEIPESQLFVYRESIKKIRQEAFSNKAAISALNAVEKRALSTIQADLNGKAEIAATQKKRGKKAGRNNFEDLIRGTDGFKNWKN